MAGVSRLSGRVTKLERQAPRAAAARCPECGLPHVPTELTLAFVRGLLGPVSPSTPERRAAWARVNPPPGPLCLCACCADGRSWAELSRRTRGGGA